MKTSRQVFWAALVLVALVWMASPVTADPGTAARLVRVEAVVDAGSVRIEATADGAFDYTTYRPSEKLFVMDIAGAAPATASGAKVLKSDVVTSYRLLAFRGGDRAIARLEVLLAADSEPQVERQSADRVLITFARAGSAATAAPAPATKPEKTSVAALNTATALENVKVVKNGDQTQVQIEGNGRLTCEVVRLSNPSRVVVDFSGVKAGQAAHALTSAVQPVRGVRVGQFKPNVARVVIDLEGNDPHSVRAQGRVVTVDFAAGRSALKPAEPVVVAKSEEKTETPQIPAEMPILHIALPESLTQAAAVHAAPQNAPVAVPAAKIETPAPAPLVASSAPVPAAPASSSPVITASGPQGGATAQQGEPISVNLKDVDLKDFFRLIHEISGLNVVLDPNVRGTVTLVLDDVPWNQALDIVLRNNSLDKQLEGNVLRIATRDTVKKEAESKRDLAKAQAEAVDQILTTRTLSYAKAISVRDTLKRFLSSRGDIIADERSNTIIIKDIPSVMPEIDNLIKQLDRRTQQVEIEARVVAATRSFAREIGTQFGFGSSATGGRNIFGGLVGQTTMVSPVIRGPGLPAPPIVASGTTSMPLNSGLGAVAPTSGVTYAHSSPNFALDFIISAAESKGVGKLLSKPKVITQNNMKAEVKQGTKIPVQTVINNTISVTFIDAVLKLEVTPQIAADGTVFMDVLVENTAIDNGIPRVSGIPALTTQSAQTSVLINDGGTVVIGGVIISQQNTDISQVPLFGSIPLLGHLFKRTSVRTQSQELLFFITPRIIPT